MFTAPPVEADRRLSPVVAVGMRHTAGGVPGTAPGRVLTGREAPRGWEEAPAGSGTLDLTKLDLTKLDLTKLDLTWTEWNLLGTALVETGSRGLSIGSQLVRPKVAEPVWLREGTAPSRRC
jgi:hypothetical protein